MTSVRVSVCVFDSVTLMMRWQVWRHLQGTVALVLLTDSQLRTGRHHHEARQN